MIHMANPIEYLAIKAADKGHKSISAHLFALDYQVQQAYHAMESTVQQAMGSDGMSFGGMRPAYALSVSSSFQPQIGGLCDIISREAPYEIQTSPVYSAEHTKNKRGSTKNKHENPRSGRPTTKNRRQNGWVNRSGKRNR